VSSFYPFSYHRRLINNIAQCIHRDLKPENLLLTSNGRVKITDFGFARIAPRSQDEVRRLTFCGTDAYMSPEILMGESFGIATDIFSLGVIFAEILSRQLADERHLKRTAPGGWLVDPNEVRGMASEGAPKEFVTLAIECMSAEPERRPGMVKVLEVLTRVEGEIAERGEDASADGHVGTIKFATGGKRRPGMAPRIPSFGQIGQTGNGYETLKVDTKKDAGADRMLQDEDDEDTDDEDLEAVLTELEVNLQKNAGTVSNEEGLQDPFRSQAYSTHVVRGPSSSSNMSSVMTIKPDSPRVDDHSYSPPSAGDYDHALIPTISSMSVDSYRTARDDPMSTFSVAVATIGDNDDRDEVDHSTLRTLPKPIPVPTPVNAPPPAATPDSTQANVATTARRPDPIGPSPSLMFHRFTMIKPGAGPGTRRQSVGVFAPSASRSDNHIVGKRHSIVWSPFDFFLGRTRKHSHGSSGSTTPTSSSTSGQVHVSTRCDLCGKRLGVGYKIVLECDDCGLRCVVFLQISHWATLVGLLTRHYIL
jgi:LIM domain kinase 1